MKKKVLIGSGVVLVLLVGSVVLHPLYSSWKDKQIVAALESEVIPFVQQHDIKYFVDGSCKQIQYGNVQAVSPKGCAYMENRTDESKKNIADFSDADKKVFEEFENLLGEVMQEKFQSIGFEYPISYQQGQSFQPQTPIGLAFNISCAFCRVRYVYWPTYQALPADIEGEIWYTPINKNWYRVDQDWN